MELQFQAITGMAGSPPPLPASCFTASNRRGFHRLTSFPPPLTSSSSAAAFSSAASSSAAAVNQHACLIDVQ